MTKEKESPGHVLRYLYQCLTDKFRINLIILKSINNKYLKCMTTDVAVTGSRIKSRKDRFQFSF
jgi:hypothetical protein